MAAVFTTSAIPFHSCLRRGWDPKCIGKPNMRRVVGLRLEISAGWKAGPGGWGGWAPAVLELMSIN